MVNGVSRLGYVDMYGSCADCKSVPSGNVGSIPTISTTSSWVVTVNWHRNNRMNGATSVVRLPHLVRQVSSGTGDSQEARYN